jgi:hypothetical protein
MSKPFQSHSKSQSRSGQINNAVKKERVVVVDPTQKRRKGVNYGAGDEPSMIEKKRLEKQAKQTAIRSADSSILPDVLSPTKRGAQAQVKEDDLHKPPSLTQRPLVNLQQDLLFPKVHGIVPPDDDDESTVATAATAATEMEDEVFDDASMALDDKLLGLPGNLELDQDTTSKYFGFEARVRFMQRIQWIANQRNITCLEPEDYADDLVFEDRKERVHVTPTAFSPVRPHDFQLRSTAHSISIATLSNASSSAYMDNDSMMLRQAAMRSGEDYRDEQDADEASPYRVEAREKDMLEELDRIFQREEEEQKAAIAEEEEFQMLLSERQSALTPKKGHLVDALGNGSLTPRGAEKLRVHALVRDEGAYKDYSWSKCYASNQTAPALGPNSARSKKAVAAVTKPGTNRRKSKMERKSSTSHIKHNVASMLTFDALSKANEMIGKSPLTSTSGLKKGEAAYSDSGSDCGSDFSDSTAGTISTVGMRGEMLHKDISQEVPMSPRSQYISNCIREGLNPRASLIVRKKMTKKLELQNYGMGDKMAAILSESIADLPYLQSINIADNGLTDDGMGPIILAAMQIKGLLELNLSMNEIGTVAAEALDTYLRRSDCPLQKLVMQTADVDDFEAEAFIGAVMENRSLTELDLSSNLIGGAENLNTVYPDLVTGSEALADLLRTDGIKLKTLKLVWNMIRLDGAIDFCSSLAVNNTLTYLDLSYNSLAQDGGIALGMAIEDNHSLETLIIANNAIDAIACFTICVGIIHNFTLKKVVFDGNPIAEQGARALMLVPMHAGARVEISAAKCNVTMRDPRCWFDFTNPCRTYNLNLEDGFERAVAMVLLMVVACHHSFIFKDFELAKPGGKFHPIELQQALSKARMEFFTHREKDVVKSLSRLVESAADIKGAVHLFQEVDEDGSGEVDREELAVLINSMGIGMSEGRIDEIFNLYDVDGGGSIGLSEFLSFLKTQKLQSSLRIKDLCEMPIMIESKGNKTDKYGNPLPWYPPREGKINVEVLDGFVTKSIKKVMSAMDQRNIQAVVASASGAAVSQDNSNKGGKGAKGKNKGGDDKKNMFGGGGGAAQGDTSGAGSGLLSHGLVGTKLRLDEALACAVTMLSDGRENNKVLRMILPQMENAQDAQAIVKALTNGDRGEIMKLKREIGNALRPILGAPNGYYMLDLSDEMDRFCMTRLLEMSKTQAHGRQAEHAFFDKTQIGDLSQKRNWSCFRNEVYELEPITVNEYFASPLPRKGILEFDFICVQRPSKEEMVLPDSRIVKVLVNCCMLEPEDALKALHRLKHYRDACEQSLDCDGRTVYEPNTKRSHSIGLCLDEFYGNLHKRQHMFQATLMKESSVKLDDRGKVVDDLEEDDNEGHDVSINNKDGITIGASSHIMNALKSAGEGDTKKGKKKRNSVIEIVSYDETENNEDDMSSTQASSTKSDPSERQGSILPEGNSVHAGSRSSGKSIKDKLRELESIDHEIHDTAWKCPNCMKMNMGNAQHCMQCHASNPDYRMAHGIDLQFDENIVGKSKEESQNLIVKEVIRTKKGGRIEGPKKANTAGILDGSELTQVYANEHAKHERGEMDSDYSSDLDNRDGEDGFSTVSSSSSDDEEEDDADMKNFMKIKIKEREDERKAQIKAKKAAAKQAKINKAERLKKLARDAGELDEEEEAQDPVEDMVAKPDMTTGMQGNATKNALAHLNNNVGQKELTAEEAEMMRRAGVTDTKQEAAKLGDALLKDDMIRNDHDSHHGPKKKTEMEMFADKMKAMLQSPTVHIGLKARRMIEWMEETFGRAWIMCRHLMLILQCFRGIGHKKQTKYFGTYRVDMLVGLFHRLVDIHNFEIVLKALSPFEVACVYARLGWLHLFNPCKPEGGWEIDLTRPEERLVAKMLCELATVEPGDNWVEQYFQWQRDTDGMPGWELTTPWLSEDGMPARGILTIYYYSGEGRGLKQCKPNIPFRKSLLYLVLIKEEEIVEEGFRDRPAPKGIGEPYMYNNSARWIQYLGAIVDLTRTR